MGASQGGGSINELVHGAQETSHLSVDSHLLQKQSEASRQFTWGGGATQLSSEQVINTLLLPRGACFTLKQRARSRRQICPHIWRHSAREFH